MNRRQLLQMISVALAFPTSLLKASTEPAKFKPTICCLVGTKGKLNLGNGNEVVWSPSQGKNLVMLKYNNQETLIPLYKCDDEQKDWENMQTWHGSQYNTSMGFIFRKDDKTAMIIGGELKT